ncbi:MAG: hypothetical protein LBP33_10835 [Candidatus Adiutrix sp.]|jgi:hypothetical protein|nr:hypothetical protein [Candidatus Adiutrix sp.]
MKKYLITLLALSFLICPAAQSLSAERAPAGRSGKSGLAISSEMFQALKAAPKAAGRTVFEGGAKEFNRMIDKEYADRPKSERPYLSPLRLAELSDSLVRSYRAGNRALAEELAARLPIEASIDEKIDFLEQITKLYLQQAGPGPGAKSK